MSFTLACMFYFLTEKEIEDMIPGELFPSIWKDFSAMIF